MPAADSGSRGYSRRIAIALAVLAAVAALQGGFAVWAVGLSEHHVLRGRIASDIKQGFTDLWRDKQIVRNWLTQPIQTQGEGERDALLLRMSNTLDRLDALHEQATRLDNGPAALGRQTQRHEALRVLRASLHSLTSSLRSLDGQSAGLDPAVARARADKLFDDIDGHDLRNLLADSLAREELSLREKRGDTDNSLLRLRYLWIGTTAALVLAALFLAAAFARALRAPLLALAEGAAALRDGRLSHRVALSGIDEFGDVARSMNAMAAELSAHRERESHTRRVLEDQVAQRTADLTLAFNAQREADARRRQLFADISHELRTPTTAIRGEAQVALRGGDKTASAYRESLQRIEATTRQLGATIDDLLTMARSDIDSLSLRREPVDLGAVLEDVHSLGTAMANPRNIRLEAAHWTGDLTMLGDAGRLRQLFLVLIDNAVRYSHPGGSVRLAARRIDGDAACIEVAISDRGIGVAESEMPRIFDRGYRAPNAAEHASDGSGLGLPIARLLARGHGGEIVLKSSPQEGTVAVVTLPLATPQVGAPE